ncbi:MAG TPA: hypothetical protein VFX22_07195, partial [Candidatus Kapabacteria bacterium]|nr:hypothetical protein [Candidatus Kapabacteria bacterium]
MTSPPLHERTTKPTNRLPKALEVLFGVVVLLELIAPFTPRSYGLDGGYHLIWIQQFSELFVHGTLMPRWSPMA